MPATAWRNAVRTFVSPRPGVKQDPPRPELTQRQWPCGLAGNPAADRLVALASVLSFPGAAIVLERDRTTVPGVVGIWMNCHARDVLAAHDLPITDPLEIERILSLFELRGDPLTPASGRGVGEVVTPLGRFHVITSGPLTALMADLETSSLPVVPEPGPASPWRLVRDYAHYVGVIPLDREWRARALSLTAADLPPLAPMLDLFRLLPFLAIVEVVASGQDPITVMATEEYLREHNDTSIWAGQQDYVSFVRMQDSATGYGDAIGVFTGTFELGRSRSDPAGDAEFGDYVWARHYIVDNLPATWILSPPAVLRSGNSTDDRLRAAATSGVPEFGIPIVTVDRDETGGLSVMIANEAAQTSGLIPMNASAISQRFWDRMAERLPEAMDGLGTMMQADVDETVVTVYINRVGERRFELAWLSSPGTHSEEALADSADARAVLHLNGRVLSVTQAFCAVLNLDRQALVGKRLAAVLPAAGLSAVSEELLNEAAFNRRGERLVALPRRSPDASTTDLRWALWTASWLAPDLQGRSGRIAFDVTDIGAVTVVPGNLLTRDPLTGLHNRAALTAVLRADPRARYDGVAFLDVYGFKAINDKYGPLVGDQCLITIANWLAQLAGPSDLVVRPSGDEFVVLAERVQSLVAAVERLGWPAVSLDGVAIPIRLRLGWSARSDHASLAETARAADLALSAAKTSSSSTVLRHIPEMADTLARKAEQEQVLRETLDGAGLSVAYQPIVDVVTGTAVGFEALLRSQPASGVGPTDLISAAERLGLAGRLYERAVEVAIRDADLVLAGNTADLWLNLSRSQLAGEAVVPELLAMLRNGGVPADRVVIEVTERDVDEPSGHIAWTLNALRRKGLRFAVDDFGKGASNLAALQQLEVDIVKLDLSLLPKSSDDPRWSLVDAVNRMLTSLGLTVVAEGVEHTEQAERLAELGIRYQQGYLHGRPIQPDRP